MVEVSGLSSTETADVASYHIAVCPCDNRFPHSWKPDDAAPGLADLSDGVDVELHRCLHLRTGELGVPVLVVPAATEGVDHGVERGEDLTPSGLAAQTDPGDAGPVELAGGLGDLRHVGFRDRDAGRGQHLLVVHEEGRLAVERRRVHPAPVGQCVLERRDEVVRVVARCPVHVGLEVDQPAVLRPHLGLVVADHHHVELAAAGGHRRGDLRAGLVLREGDELERDAGVLLLELSGQRDRVFICEFETRAMVTASPPPSVKEPAPAQAVAVSAVAISALMPATSRRRGERITGPPFSSGWWRGRAPGRQPGGTTDVGDEHGREASAERAEDRLVPRGSAGQQDGGGAGADHVESDGDGAPGEAGHDGTACGVVEVAADLADRPEIAELVEDGCVDEGAGEQCA